MTTTDNDLQKRHHEVAWTATQEAGCSHHASERQRRQTLLLDKQERCIVVWRAFERDGRCACKSYVTIDHQARAERLIRSVVQLSLLRERILAWLIVRIGSAVALQRSQVCLTLLETCIGAGAAERLACCTIGIYLGLGSSWQREQRKSGERESGYEM